MTPLLYILWYYSGVSLWTIVVLLIKNEITIGDVILGIFVGLLGPVVLIVLLIVLAINLLMVHGGTELYRKKKD